MRKRKWVMRWQVSLMPDPAMIPDATVFLHASQCFKPTTIATIARQTDSQYASTAVLTDSSQQIIEPESIRMQTPTLEDLMMLLDENIFTNQDPMLTGLDPTMMVLRPEQKEETDMTQQDIPIANE